MELETRRFGIIEVDDEDIFRVPNGIPGFPGLRRVTTAAAPSQPAQSQGGAWRQAPGWVPRSR